MQNLDEQRDDRDSAVKVLGELLLLYALQAADFGLIAQFWTGSRESVLPAGATHPYPG